MPLKKQEKSDVIKKFAQAKGDTGSPEIQVALLSTQIEKLQGHLTINKKDGPAKSSLLTKVAKRRRLLRYLVSRNFERYQNLIKSLGMRK